MWFLGLIGSSSRFRIPEINRHLNKHFVRPHANFTSPLDIPRCLRGLRLCLQQNDPHLISHSFLTTSTWILPVYTPWCLPPFHPPVSTLSLDGSQCALPSALLRVASGLAFLNPRCFFPSILRPQMRFSKSLLLCRVCSHMLELPLSMPLLLRWLC